MTPNVDFLELLRPSEQMWCVTTYFHIIEANLKNIHGDRFFYVKNMIESRPIVIIQKLVLS